MSHVTCYRLQVTGYKLQVLGADSEDEGWSYGASDDGTCVQDYSQCDGTQWDGSEFGPYKCCSGATCVKNSDSYWMCKP